MAGPNVGVLVWPLLAHRLKGLSVYFMAGALGLVLPVGVARLPIIGGAAVLVWLVAVETSGLWPFERSHSP